ncbi:MAG: sulfatase [Candidatus Cyclobacteriaceae bacterium M3_2C_046]
MKIQLTQQIYIGLIMIMVLGCTSNSNTDKPDQAFSKPNILFIAVDDLRPEFGAYGANHIESPSLDKLASQSLVFDRAYCNVPVCGASRASLLSGVRPGRNRFLGYNTWLDQDYPDVTSLPKHFKNNGYTTISNGKIYHHPQDDSLAWDEVWQPSNQYNIWRDYVTGENLRIEQDSTVRGYPYEKAAVPDSAYFDGKIAQKAIKDLKKLKAEGKPFFLAVGFIKPHLPFNAPAKYWEKYDPDQISLPANYLQPETTPQEAFHNFGELRNYSGIPKQGPVSDEMANKLIHGYYACVSYIDAQVGSVVDALKELELEQNTIVIIWGDHGWNLGDHQLWCKHCNFESSLHVPLMIKVPGKTSGKHTQAITEYIDIYPSLSELAGLPRPDHLDGESFVPLIEGNNREKNYAISKFHDGVTLIRGDLFYTEWLDDQDQVKARMLFDHAKDPLELDNLAEKPEFQNTVEEMSQMLRDHWGDDFFMDRRAL